MTFSPLRFLLRLCAAPFHGSCGLLLATLLLAGCGGSEESSQELVLTDPAHYVHFYPSKDILPYPNNLLFAGSTDGTLNSDFDPASPAAAMLEPLNTLDGFSTIAPITAAFSEDPDADSLQAGTTVRLFEVVTAGKGGAVTAVVRELAPSEYWVRLDLATPHGLAIIPTHALKPKSGYMAMLTRGVRTATGAAFAPSTVYALCKAGEPLVTDTGVSRVDRVKDADAAALEPIRQHIRAQEDALLAFDTTLSRDDIVLSWSFTTQSVDDVLLAVRASVDSNPPPPSDLHPFTPFGWKGTGKVYAGTITLPYYQAIPTAEDPEAPLHGFWHGPNGSFLTADNPMPAPTTVHPIPVLLVVPNGPRPANGWPVVIFQHGNTSNRGALMAIAQAINDAGFAAVAIDLPMHGITGLETDGSAQLRQDGIERTFDLDLLVNGTPQPGSDGKIDTSGAYFMKLNQILTSRDNIRQGVADLLGLRRGLEVMDYDGDHQGDFDMTQVRFIGHSLGATVGAVYLGVEDKVGASALGMPGAAIAKQLDGSPTSGPSIALGMAENGLIKGTADYERFLAAVQMVLDPADPLNYAPTMNHQRPLHIVEVVGGRAVPKYTDGLPDGTQISPPDQIVPNNVLNAPLTVASPTAGTDPLWQVMGLQIAAGPVTGTNLQRVSRFNAGHHSSLISSFDAEGNTDATSAAVMREMQKQIVSFVTSNGTALLMDDASLVNDH